MPDVTGPEIAARWTDPGHAYALLQRLPNPDPVLRKQGRDQHAYEAIRYDPHVMGELRSVRAGLLGFEWRLIPGDDSRKARRALDLVRDVMARPPGPDLDWRDLIWTIGYAIFTGYAVHEVVWERDGSTLVPARILDRPAARFTFASEDNALRLLTRGQPLRGEAVPPRRFLLSRHMASHDNPYAVAVFSSCFWPYTFKHSGFRYFVSLCEKYGLPWVIGKYPEGTAEGTADELQQRLSRLVRDVTAVVPQNTEIEITEAAASQSSATPQERLIDVCNRELSKALTSQTLATEIQGQGSRAASETHRGRERAVQQSDREIVSATLNRLFRWITDLNFGPEVPAPRHQFYEESQARKDWAELFDTARHYLPIGEGEAYERLGLTPPQAGEKLLAGGPGDPPADAHEMTACPRCGGLEFARDAGEDWERALDAAIDAVEDPEAMEGMEEDLVRPLLQAADDDPEQLRSRLAERYPDMDAGGLEDLLGRVLFTARTWGQLSDADA